jgi:adenosine deaminase
VTTGVTPAWLRALPKAEVHVHLEGSLPPDLLERAATRRGVEPPARRFDGLSSFLDFLDRSCGLLTEPGELSELARRTCERFAADGVRYADVIVNPTHWRPWRGRLDELLDALDRGFGAAEDAGLATVGLCPSIERRQTSEEAVELVEALIAIDCPRVRGLSIDGDEARAGRTGERFAPAFSRARAAGLQLVAHAGESSGPEGVRDALDLLRVDRIDHGVRAIEDDALVAELAARRVPLGICLTSNVTLGLYPDVESHPIERLRRAGVRVSLNTDDPELLETTLVDEYARGADAFGWGRTALVELARTSIEASFAEPAMRASLLAELAEHASPRGSAGRAC